MRNRSTNQSVADGGWGAAMHAPGDSTRPRRWRGLIAVVAGAVAFGACGRQSAGASAPATLRSRVESHVVADRIKQLDAIALDDSTAYVAWLDQSAEGYRIWGATCRMTPRGEPEWVQESPVLWANGTILQFQLVAIDGSPGMVFCGRGRLFWQRRPAPEPPIRVNADSDYVRSFFAVPRPQGPECLAVSQVQHLDAKPQYEFVSFSVGTGAPRRAKVAEVDLPDAFPVPPPSATHDLGGTRVTFCIARGGGGSGGPPAAQRSVELHSFLLQRSDSTDWRIGGVVRVAVAVASLQIPQTWSLAMLPLGWPACILSTPCTYLVLWNRAGLNPTAQVLSGVEGSGDDLSQPRTACVQWDASHIVIAWIDAARQMAHPEQAYAREIDPSTRGGDLELATLSESNWQVKRSSQQFQQSGSTAECLCPVRLGRAIIICWAGPRADQGSTQGPVPEEWVSCRRLPTQEE